MRGIFRGGVLIVLLSYCKLAVALEPTIKVVVETPQRPVVNGQTNLPDGTELMISIRRKESNFVAEDQVKVAGGNFRSRKFSERGSNLNPGKYSVEVLMPFPGVQSESVRSIIGEHGEELTGPLVKREQLGNLVKYVSTFQVGGAVDARADHAARAREKKDNEKWVRDSCNWIFDTSETLRREGKLTGRELTPDEKQAKFDNCVKEVAARSKPHSAHP